MTGLHPGWKMPWSECRYSPTSESNGSCMVPSPIRQTGNMLLGPSGIRNFWLCCGSQVGIAWGPGAGKYLAQWMIHGAADISMASF